MPKSKKKSFLKRAIIVIVVLGLLIGGYLFYKASRYVPAAYELVFKKEIELKKTEQDKINVLLLGIGGGRHDGPLLTDTIIFASIDVPNKRVNLISIPRDLWIPDLKAKINHTYAYAEEKQPGGGLLLTKKTVEKVVGQQIDYGFRIDFSGFEKAVDEVGGLEVDVARTFDDYAYPVNGKENDLCEWQEDAIASLSAQIATASATEADLFPCRYEHLHFDQGKQKMNGETALKYVRSRHALGPEGSDFARSQRQERVIQAFRENLISAGTLLNPARVLGLYEILRDSIDMDVKEDELDDFVKLFQKIKDAEINSVVLTEATGNEEPNELLMNPPSGPETRYQWVLIPKAGMDDYSDIHAYVQCVTKTGTDCTLTPTPIKSGLTPSQSLTAPTRRVTRTPTRGN